MLLHNVFTVIFLSFFYTVNLSAQNNDGHNVHIQKSSTQTAQTHKPKEHAYTTKELVDRHNAYIKNEYEDLFSSTDAIERELLYLIYAVQREQSFKKAQNLLKRAHTVYESITAQKLSQEKKAAAYEIIGAVIVRCSILLIDAARLQLLSILGKIDTHLAYWRDKKNRPVHYFFHKSPLKWLMGDAQESEIRDNIITLERLQGKLYYDLGALTSYTYEFVPYESSHSCCAWVMRLCDMIPLHSEENTQTVDIFDRTMQKLIYKMDTVYDMENKLMALIAPAQKPHHITRHWMHYAALCSVLYCLYKNTEFTNKWLGFDALSGYADSLKTVIQDNIVTPVQDIWKTLIGENDEHQKRFERIEQLNNELEKCIPEVRTLGEKLASPNVNNNTHENMLAVKDIAANYRKEVLDSIKLKLTKFFDENSDSTTKNSNDELRRRILILCEKNDASGLRDLCNKLEISLFNFGKDTENFINFTLLEQQLYIAQLLEVAASNVTSYDAYVREDLITYVKNELIPTISKPTADIMDLIKQGSEDYLSIKKQTQLTAQLLFLIPCGLAILPALKLYRWMKTYDYTVLRSSLAEVQSFFIESVFPLSTTSYGKLLFLLHKLRYQATHGIPSNNKMRSEFLIDITKLESLEFNNEQKRLIIDNMRHRYPFLSGQYAS